MVTSKPRYGILYLHALDLRTQHERGSSSDCLFVSKIVYGSHQLINACCCHGLIGFVVLLNQMPAVLQVQLCKVLCFKAANCAEFCKCCLNPSYLSHGDMYSRWCAKSNRALQ